ncbi:LCP family protein [Amycolatopsis anabasis]|uniref:LCP family protein n=1 Tax=Amycolatopsis anabasis TaxID=1840409 RepID=UPI00131E8A01|nr:LCP family protein [Amycolatopsis anabasis]
MNLDRTELLIREAFTEEADRAVDPRVVLAGLHRGKPRRRTPALMVAAAAAVVLAAVTAVVVPRLVPDPAADSPAAPAAAVDQNILLAGTDGSGFTDSIVLAHLGRDGAASAISLPRDSFVDVPGYGMRKLNSAYAQARADALAQGRDQAGADEAGARTLADTVRRLTGVAVDRYAVVDIAGFDRLSTAVGGVPVCLRAATHDPLSGASFPAGRQTLAGPNALAFLRQRHGLPAGDLDRIVRLQAFLRSLVHQVLAGPVLTDRRALNTLLDTVRTTVRTSPGWDLLTFADQVRGLRGDALRIGTVPIAGMDLRTPDGGSAVELAPEQVRSFVQAFTSGGATAAPPASGGATVLPPDDVPCVN